MQKSFKKHSNNTKLPKSSLRIATTAINVRDAIYNRKEKIFLPMRYHNVNDNHV